MATTFQYKVRDKAGNTVTGTLVADSEMLVLQRLREMGYTPLEVGKEKKGLAFEINIKKAKVKLKDLSVFSRQFATMINSGLPILRAMSILAEQTDNKLLGQTLAKCRTDVEQGASLSGAFAKHPKVFNDLYVSMVKSGEMGGSLDTTLLKLAAMLEREVHLRGKIKSAMTYPVAVVGLVFLIMAAMLLFVVPQFEGIYGQLGGTLPMPTRVLLMMSEAFKKYWFMFIGACFVARFLIRRYKATEKGRLQLDRLKLRVPVFGALFHKTAMSRFSSTLSMLLSAGVPILQAFDIVTDTVNNKVVSGAVTDVQSSVREGESIAKPLARHAVFPPMVVQMIAVGEETGQVDTMLDKVAQFYDQEIEAAVDALTSLIEPLLIAVIGACVGGAVIALYMPMFGIISEIE